MFDNLKAHNISSDSSLPSSLLSILKDKGCFILSTCQRTLILEITEMPSKVSLLATSSIKTETQELIKNLIPLSEKSPVQAYLGFEAYKVALEILCGLKSHIKGEYEIVGQFKKSLQEYLENSQRNPWLIKILEKLLKDNKDVRSQFLTHVGTKSYARLVRKILQSRINNIDETCSSESIAQRSDILIVGSGSLAKDLVGQLSKKFSLHLTARNPQRLEQLTSHFSETCSTNQKFQMVNWLDYDQYIKYPFIVLAIGSDEKYFDHDFLNSWKDHNPHHRLFLDLGNPSVLNINLNLDQTEHQHHSLLQDKSILLLKDLFAQVQEEDQTQFEKILQAHEYINCLLKNRKIFSPLPPQAQTQTESHETNTVFSISPRNKTFMNPFKFHAVNKS
jgi:glutamyl-tRNA reductase